jgi:hypothetical protein
MEDCLKDEMLDFVSHVLVSLPLEFSEFSAKLLDVRERERKEGWFGRYDDAAAHHMDALRTERDELDATSNQFARSFKLQRGELLRKEDQRRAGFEMSWQKKTEQTAREAARELAELKRAIEYWEKDHAEAKKGAAAELDRIRNNKQN